MNIAIIDGKVVAQAISRLAKRWTGIDTDTQAVAMDVLLHAHQNAEVSLVNKLYLMLGKGARHEAMTNWITLYCPVSVNTAAATKEARPFLLDKSKVMADAALLDVAGQASRNPWYTKAPSKAPDEVFDLARAVKALIAKADKQVKEGRSVSDSDALGKLRELHSTIKPVVKAEAEA